MKKHVSELPIETIALAAQRASHRAAVNAVEAGRGVYGLEDGKLVKFGLGDLTLPREIRVEEDLHVQAA
jgi:hypothetical protein